MDEFVFGREIRYQGAIVQNDRILLIKHMPLRGGSPYWLIPGGGIEDGETEIECVRREMKEETNLVVEVIRLVLDEPGPLATFEQFADSTLNLVLRAYLPDLDNRLGTISELHTEIDKRFAEAGIEIAFPQRDLHLRSGWDAARPASSDEARNGEKDGAPASSRQIS